MLKQKSQSTDEALEKTRRELEEYKRQVEENKKATEETNALMRRFFMINSGANSGPSV